ncbi:MAG: NUDIX hydrolase [Thermomicrobiales bacterium]
MRACATLKASSSGGRDGGGAGEGDRVDCAASGRRSRAAALSARDGGYSIPAGTVEPGEAPRDAVLREAREETGLQAVAIQQELGFVDTQFPDDERLIVRATTVYARPTVESFDWARLRRGIRVRRERQSEGFTLITYQSGIRSRTPPMPPTR